MIVKKKALTFKKREILKKWKGILDGLCIFFFFFFQLCLPNNSLLLRRMIISIVQQKSNSKKVNETYDHLWSKECSAEDNFVSLFSGVVVAVVIKITFYGLSNSKTFKTSSFYVLFVCFFVPVISARIGAKFKNQEFK